MKFEELRFVCEEAAKELASRGERPVPPTMVLPQPTRTQLLKLAGFPEDDELRHAYLAQFAEDRLVAESIPCWGFLVEGEVEGHDVLVAVYGARKHAPHITAVPLSADNELGDFLPSEELDPTAMPFLHPLQHAVDSLPGEPGGDDSFGPDNPTLPIIS